MRSSWIALLIGVALIGHGTAAFAAGAPEGPAGPGPASAAPAPSEQPAFWGTRLINLPTTTGIAKGDLLLRISHRFQGPVDGGFGTFFGLDSGANILFSLGYGITDRLSISAGRARLNQEWEFGLDWLAAKQKPGRGFPLAATLHAALDWVTEEGSRTARGSFQLSLSRQIGPRLSILAVPAYTTRTADLELEPQGTFAVGLGARYMAFHDLSVLVEWVPVIAGYREAHDGWGLGLEKKIGGHVFQVFFTNVFGLASSQFIAGGDLGLADFDFRFGFNIFRTF